MNPVIQKIKRKLWQMLVMKLRNTSIYLFLYKSYWHSILNKSSLNQIDSYYTALPNPGAGIGHQLANWIAGYWFAQQFGLKYVYSSFTDKKWDSFLGLGENELKIKELRKKGYKRVRLPLFREHDKSELEIQKKIISSYKKKKVFFTAELDQFYKDQYGVTEHLQNKFYSSKSRKNQNLIYKENSFNVAIHVRRGDIVEGQKINENLTMRWLTNEYFEKTLRNTLSIIKTDKEINIYLFSQGEKKDYKEFEKFPNLHFCLDMGAVNSFSHMVYADALIISKSSFSYKPALINKGLKLVPEDFWHGYPKGSNWLKVNKEGEIIL